MAVGNVIPAGWMIYHLVSRGLTSMILMLMLIKNLCFIFCWICLSAQLVARIYLVLGSDSFGWSILLVHEETHGNSCLMTRCSSVWEIPYSTTFDCTMHRSVETTVTEGREKWLVLFRYCWVIRITSKSTLLILSYEWKCSFTNFAKIFHVDMFVFWNILWYNIFKMWWGTRSLNDVSFEGKILISEWLV